MRLKVTNTNKEWVILIAEFELVSLCVSNKMIIALRPLNDSH